MIVDSSVWLELLQEGPLLSKCQKAISRKDLKVPAFVLFEVYKKLKVLASEEIALEAIATLSKNEVLELNREIAILAGDLSLEHDLPMTDSLVLAHAEYLGETLLTLDNDFSKVPSVEIIR